MTGAAFRGWDLTSWLVTTADSPAVSACSLVGSGASTMSSTVGTAGLIASEAAIIDGSDEWWADTVWNCRGRCRLGRSQTPGRCVVVGVASGCSHGSRVRRWRPARRLPRSRPRRISRRGAVMVKNGQKRF